MCIKMWIFFSKLEGYFSIHHVQLAIYPAIFIVEYNEIAAAGKSQKTLQGKILAKKRMAQKIPISGKSITQTF